MPSDPVFLDSSGWIALLNGRDENHAAAMAQWQRLRERKSKIILTDWIIAETGNGVAGTPLRGRFVGAVRFLLINRDYQLIRVDRSLLERAIDLYASRSDKAWGLVDCASFVVMEDLNIREALTADHHFEQAGFRRLLHRPGGSGGRMNGSN